MSEEKTNSPERNPIKRTTQFCYDIIRPPTTYRNPSPLREYKSCKFSPAEIEISRNTPSEGLVTILNLPHHSQYPRSPVKLATGEQIMKIQRWREIARLSNESKNP